MAQRKQYSGEFKAKPVGSQRKTLSFLLADSPRSSSHHSRSSQRSPARAGARRKRAP